MANKIRIKRTSTTAITTGTLVIGELGYSSLAGTQSNTGDRLYIGLGATDGTTTPYVVGGKYFTDMLDQVPGTLTASSAILVDANSKIDNINVGNITITGSSGVISSTNSNGNITLTPNGTGYVSISGTNALVLPAGTTAQQAPSVNGAIRYNTTTSAFEGYAGGNWSSLGGVRSVDNLTYIIAESSPGASDDIIHFYASNNTTAVEVARLDTNSLRLLQTTASTSTTSGALQVAGGAGIAGNLNVGGNVAITGTSTHTDLATFSNGVTISGNTTAATEYFRITDGAGTPVTKFLVDTASGNTTISGTLALTGAATLSSTLDVTGNFNINTNKFQVVASSGNTTIAGTLGVTGTSTLAAMTATTGSFSSTLAATGDFSVNTNKFTVTAASGNTAIAGTLGVTGDVAINTNKFTVTAASGNTAIAGTLSAGNTSVTGTLSATSDFAINTNKFTVTASSGNTAIAGTLGVTSDLSVNTNKFTVAASTGNTSVGGTLTVSSTSSFSGNLAMNSFRITGLADPVVSSDAATKNYVDSMSQGLHVHAPVDFATTTDIATTLSITVTYTGGPATGVNLNDPGPGSYLTFSASPTFTYYNNTTGSNESATFANHGQARILVMGQTDAKQNGIYYWATSTTFVRAIDADASYAYNGAAATLATGTAVITLTTGSTAYIKVGMPVYKVGGTGVLGANPVVVSIDSGTQVTLNVDHATAGAINLAFGYGDLAGGDFVYVSDTGYGYVQTTEGILFGTNNVTFSQFAGQGSWTAGSGLTLTANQFSVNLETNSGLTLSTGKLQVNSTIAGNGLSYSSGVITATGTTNRISVSGSGIDIASTYVGQSSITTLGTITTGTWNGTAIGSAYGGTGFTTYASGDIIYASAANTLSKLAKGTDGQVLMLSSGVPAWSDIDGGTF